MRQVYGRMMQIPAATRIFVRELRGGIRGFRVFVACLALGVASVAVVGTVRSSVERVFRGKDPQFSAAMRRSSSATDGR